MPQFEVAPTAGPTVFVRARSEADAVARHLERSGLEAPSDGPAASGLEAPPVDLAEPEPGSGWREVRVGGAAWGRVRPRDRMRFRRD